MNAFQSIYFRKHCIKTDLVASFHLFVLQCEDETVFVLLLC